ncbi:MAG: hypothetical protein AABY18_04440 [Candidatus Thermoplasmatota archaeon]
MTMHQSLQEAPQPTETLLTDEAGIGTLGIVLIVVLLLILFGVIGFSFNS